MTIQYINRPAPFALDPAIALLGNEPEGMAIDFTSMRAWVRDRETAANNFLGDPNNLLTYASPSPKWIFNKAGLLESGTGLRCEYDPVTYEPLGIRVEGQATNLLLQSKFAGSWVAFSATLTPNTATAPDGTLTAAKITATSAGWAGYQSMTLTAGVAYTLSVWLKSAVAKTIQLGIGAGVTSVDVTTEWKRFSFTYTPTVAANNIVIRGNDPLETVAEVFVWGAQLEAGSVATSYIPTQASAVTRAADNITLARTGTPEGTVIIEARTAPGISGIQSLWWYSDGTNNNRIALSRVGNKIYFQISTPGQSSIVNLNVDAPDNDTDFKIAATWKAGASGVSLNGQDALTDTSYTGPMPAVTTIGSGRREVSGSEWGGTIKSEVVLPRAMSAAELKAASALS